MLENGQEIYSCLVVRNNDGLDIFDNWCPSMSSLNGSSGNLFLGFSKSQYHRMPISICSEISENQFT